MPQGLIFKCFKPTLGPDSQTTKSELNKVSIQIKKSLVEE